MELPIGMLLRPLTVGPITIEELVEWAVVSGDGNPLHFDTHIARSQGFPDVLVSGAFKMSLGLPDARGEYRSRLEDQAVDVP